MILIFIFGFISSEAPSQEKDYWSNAKSGNTKIYSLTFFDSLNALAVSGEGDSLVSMDKGVTWNYVKIIPQWFSDEKYFWKADIYCAIIKSTDGGNTWTQYNEGKQEHFCGYYLKDRNTGYNVASEFLNKVSSKINTHLLLDELDYLLAKPQKCTEYYCNEEEGWMLGWCVKDFIFAEEPH
jgi:hypothetical protein